MQKLLCPRWMSQHGSLTVLIAVVAIGCAAGATEPRRSSGADGGAGADAGSADQDATSGTPDATAPRLSDRTCTACAGDAECGDGVCAALEGGRACLPACGPDLYCPPSFHCDASGPDGRAVCVPSSGGCCADADGDGYGVGASCSMLDCDDTSGAVHPGAAEACNGRDDDCAGGADDGFECHDGESQSCDGCGLSGSRVCSGCAWSACSVGVSFRVEGNDGRLAHGCGTECDSDWCACGSAPCMIQSGSIGALPPGRYRASLLFGVSGTATLSFEVVAGGRTLASDSGAYTGGSLTHDIEFDYPSGCASVEIRVGTSDTPCVRLYQTDIARVGG